MSGLFFYDRYQTQKKLYTDHQIETSTMEFETLKEAYATTAQTIFNIAVNTETVCSLMAEASSSSDPVKVDSIRKQLYQELFPVYLELEANNLRQLHFHLPGSISFLRFHRPEKYGDSLKGVRLSIDAVNRTKKEAHGFEEGRIFNGFRHVYPLFHKGRFVGTVELSYSFDAIKELASRLYPSQYDLILKKEVIDATVFDEERSNYFESIFEGFVHDRRLKPSYSLFSAEILAKIAFAAKEKGKIDLKKPYNQFQDVEIEGSGYTVAFNSLNSFNGEQVGYIINYKNENYYLALKKNLWESILSGTVLSLFVSILIAYFLFRLAVQKEQLKRMANSDGLTGIANRAALEKSLKTWIEYAKRHHEPLSLIFFDVDHFKQVNDRFGHHVGDQALIDVSRIVSERLRESDQFGRWGGEEFVIFLPKTSVDEAVLVAESLRKKIAEHTFEHGSMSCSFGVTEYDGEESVESFVARADTMLYEAKHSGRNRVISR